jgi:hypothetical protein
MRIIAVIDDAGVIERILKHLSVWDPQPETHSPAGPDPPLPKGESIPLIYHPVPDIACLSGLRTRMQRPFLVLRGSTTR